MRVLMLAHRLPYPPTTGDKVRAYHVARHLARRHELTLAFPVDEPRPATALERLRREIPDLEYALIRRRPRRLAAFAHLLRGGSATVAYFGSAALRSRLAARLVGGGFDLLYVSSSSMAQYAAAAPGVPVVMDFVDVDSDKWLQYGAQLPAWQAWVYRLEGRRLRAHETAAARCADRCLVVSREEEALLRTLAPWCATTVIPNGVDLDHFRPAPVPADSPTVIFTGAMDYFPNADAAAWFCGEVFPRVRAAVPAARLLIVGKSPVAAVRALAAQPGVEVTGAVPEATPYFRRAAVAVAPLRVARGIQNKVLEAMAMGLPVVATSRAHAGIEAEPGRHLFVEDDPAASAALIARLLGDAPLRRAIGAAARRFVESHHSWNRLLTRLDGVIADVMVSARAAAPGPAAPAMVPEPGLSGGRR
jgi:sugar transferase (PEP-CTERM/EpsH1 system associated)